MTALPSRLVLYDGVCGFCDRSVRYLLDHDPEGNLSFAPLQGETAADLRARHAEIPEDLDTVIFVEREGDEERVYFRSKAFMRLARHTRGVPKVLSYLRFVLPAFIADIGYRLIAKVRYRIFGKMDQCRIPSPDERARFLP